MFGSVNGTATTHPPTQEVTTMLTDADVDAMLAEAHAATQATWQTLTTARCGTTVNTCGDHDMVVCLRSYGADTPEADVIAGTAVPCEVVLTEDGGQYHRDGWHQGPVGPADTWVAFERWTTEGRVAHGFVDPSSRRLVQAG